MDKCREEFEEIARELDLDCEWVDLTGTTVLYGANGRKKDGCYNDFTTDTAWNFYRVQQAKVEKLQKQLSEYIFVSETIDEMYVKEVQKSDELQKRMDKAIRLLVEAELYQSEPNIDLAVKALKGEG